MSHYEVFGESIGTTNYASDVVVVVVVIFAMEQSILI